MTLASFNPLLHDALSVRDGHRVALSFAPAGGVLPCTGGTLHVDPLRLSLGDGPLLSQVLRLVNAGGLLTGGGGGWQGLLFGGPRTLEAWSGPMQVDVGEDGVATIHRVDMLLGGSRGAGGGGGGCGFVSAARACSGRTAAPALRDSMPRSPPPPPPTPAACPCSQPPPPAADRVRVSVWGSVDTVSDAMRIRIGLPAQSLLLAGVRGLPPDYLLPLDLRGTIRRPALDWAAAARKVAVLSAMQLARPLGKGGGEKGAPPGAAALAGGGGGGTGGGGAPLARMHRASQVFLQQCAAVDSRLLREIGGPPPPPPTAPAPWDAKDGGAAAAAGATDSGGGEPPAGSEAWGSGDGADASVTASGLGSGGGGGWSDTGGGGSGGDQT
jgi:hypothetical protein